MRKTIIVDGNKLIGEAHSETNRIAYFEKSLEDTIIIKKAFLQKVCDEWNYTRGEVTLAEFLLGKEPHHFLQAALDELEEAS